jgi:N6-L-threonylcarbamoyladenine synthase
LLSGFHRVKLHELYGGVVHKLASREHHELPLLADVLTEAGVNLNDIDAFAVTRGPGLVGCLLMGLHFARGLALANNTPIVGVNHIEGHILAPMLDNPELTFPYLALVVSGGHTEILEVKGVGDYKLIARTIDDAAGEAFDKSAKLLGFPYPGGAALAATADMWANNFQLPKVMREAAGFAFQVKTAVSLLIKREREAGRLDKCGAVGACSSRAIVDALCFKLQRYS